MSEIDDIRQQMARLRFNLHTDVSGVISETREIFDWRQYLRASPLLWSAAALAAGYLLVPRKKPRVSELVEELETAGSNGLASIQALGSRPSASASKGVLGSLGITPWRMATWALKSASPLLLAAAQSYVLPMVEQWIAQQMPAQGPPGRRGPRPAEGEARRETGEIPPYSSGRRF